MAKPEDEQVGQEYNYLNPAGGKIGRAFEAVPPEVQQILNVKPGKTTQRIQQVIGWAAAADPEVLRAHQRIDKSVHTVEDIHRAALRSKDRVAHQFAAQYRHRAALTGAITALPGGLWALVGMGADVQLTAIYAVRMAAKVAQSYGYDTTVIEEQARLADVLALAAGVDSLRGVGNWLAREGMSQFLPDVLPRVLARLSVELSAEEAAKLVGRLIPGVSAAIGASIDYAFLRAAGERAIAYYHNRALAEVGALPPARQPLALPAGASTGAPTGAGAAAPASPAASVMVAPPPAGTVVDSEAPAATAERPARAMSAEAAHEAALAAVEAKPVKRRQRANRPWGVYLAIFTVVLITATVIACAALGAIVANALHLIH